MHHNVDGESFNCIDYIPHTSSETLGFIEQLSLSPKKIEYPETCGEFNSDKHYFDTLSLVLSSTFETKNRISFFLNFILPMLKKRARCLI